MASGVLRDARGRLNGKPWLLSAILVGAMGPYVPALYGLRTEQIGVYGLLAVSVGVRKRFRSPTTTSRAFTILWVAIFATAVVAAVSNASSVRSFSRVVADIDSLMLPLAAFSLGALWAPRIPARLDLFSKVITVFLSGHTLWILTGLWLDTRLVNRWFWTATAREGVETVADRALALGRHTGIFHQPLEAGAMYSIGLIMWVYSAQRKGWQIGVGHWVSLLLLLVGGTLGVSKTFLFVGLPIAFSMAVGVGRTYLGLKSMLVAVGGVGSFVGILSVIPWDGRYRLLRWLSFDSQQSGGAGFLYRYTAGRIGADGEVLAKVRDVADSSVLVGQGVGTWTGSVDNEVLNVFIWAGSVGVVLYAVALLIVLMHGLTLTMTQGMELQGWLIAALVALTVVGGVGGPVLTANRVGVALGLVLGLLTRLGPVRGHHRNLRRVNATYEGRP